MQVTKQLAKVVDKRMKAMNFSFPDVHKNSGLKISAASVWNVVNMRVKDIKEETFNDLARGLELTPAELEEMVKGTSASFKRAEVEALFHETDELSDEEMEELRPIFDMVRAEIRRRKAVGDLPRRG